MKPEPTIACKWCGKPTTMLGTKMCDGCWELERRATANPDLTKRMLATEPGSAPIKLTLTPTATVDTVGGKIPARIWEGTTDGGVPVKAWIAIIQPQTDDATLLAAFDTELKQVPAKRELTSFDIRLAI